MGLASGLKKLAGLDAPPARPFELEVVLRFGGKLNVAHVQECSDELVQLQVWDLGSVEQLDTFRKGVATLQDVTLDAVCELDDRVRIGTVLVPIAEIQYLVGWSKSQETLAKGMGFTSE